MVFRTKCISPDTIGIIPVQGYRQEEKHSIKAMQWIKYLSTKEGVCIQHARNCGEKEIGPYKVHGYYENGNGQQYVLEFRESSGTVAYTVTMTARQPDQWYEYG